MVPKKPKTKTAPRIAAMPCTQSRTSLLVKPRGWVVTGWTEETTTSGSGCCKAGQFGGQRCPIIPEGRITAKRRASANAMEAALKNMHMNPITAVQDNLARAGLRMDAVGAGGEATD